MPEFPRFTSQRNLTTQTPEVMKTGSGDTYEAIGKGIEAVSEVTQKWSAASDVLQWNTVQANFQKGLAQIESDALNDPDYNGYEKRVKELEKLKTASTEGITTGELKNKANFELSQDIDLTKIKLGNVYKKKQIEVGQINLSNSIEALQQKKLNATSPAEYLKANTSIRELLDSNIKTGIVSPEQAQKLWKEAELSSAENDIYTNPIQGKANLEAGLYDITANKKLELIEKADKLLKSREEIAKREQVKRYNANYREAMFQAFDNKLSSQSIRDLYKSDLISDAQRGKLENYIYYHLPVVEEDDLETYNKIVEMQAEGQESPEKINDAIMDSALQNKLKNTSAKQLIGKTYSDFKSRKDDLISLNSKELRAVSSEFFTDDLGEVNTPKVESALYKFHKRVQEENADGGRLAEIAQEIVTDTIRQEYPEINNIETINRVKEMFGVKTDEAQEIPPPISETQEASPFVEYPDAFKENGVWKVIKNGKKYRVEE